jgi:hypothetical protein
MIGNDKKPTLDIIAIVILGILTLATLILQSVMLTSQTSKLETGLFNILQLILSLGFSWLLTRIVTRSEFQESLQRFAISAYRRIRDLDKSLIRMKAELDQMRSGYPKNNIHELDVLSSIADSMSDTVISSIADWTEVIGDELEKEKRIRELEERYSKVQLSTIQIGEDVSTVEENKELKAIKSEVERLRSEIPLMLGYDIKPLSTYESPEIIEKGLKSALENQGELLLYADVEKGLSYEDLLAYEEGQQLFLFPDRAMHSFDFVILDKPIGTEGGRHLGNLINPYSHLGIDHIEFNMALLNSLTPYIPYSENGFPDIDNIPIQFICVSPSNRNHIIVRFTRIRK